jgi:hypothetical protein
VLRGQTIRATSSESAWQPCAPKVVSDRLGHPTTSFTMDVYADALPAVEETAAAMVAALALGDDG